GSANKGGGVRATAASALGREAWARRLPLLPAFIYVFLVTQIPFVLTIYYSFFSWNLLKPGSFHFAGLENYGSIFTNESIRIAVWNTVLLTDRKSTRLNSSHGSISYAVFCLKKKKI